MLGGKHEEFRMPAPPEMWNAFIEHLEEMIAGRRWELAPLKDGSMRLRRRYHGEEFDITKERIAQIEHEIANIQNTIHRVRSEYATGN